MKRNYVVDSIVNEYNKKKRYEEKMELEKFRQKNCIYCKNRNTYKCEIRRDINNNLNCVYKEL